MNGSTCNAPKRGKKNVLHFPGSYRKNTHTDARTVNDSYRQKSQICLSRFQLCNSKATKASEQHIKKKKENYGRHDRSLFSTFPFCPWYVKLKKNLWFIGLNSWHFDFKLKMQNRKTSDCLLFFFLFSFNTLPYLDPQQYTLFTFVVSQMSGCPKYW